MRRWLGSGDRHGPRLGAVLLSRPCGEPAERRGRRTPSPRTRTRSRSRRAAESCSTTSAATIACRRRASAMRQADSLFDRRRCQGGVPHAGDRASIPRRWRRRCAPAFPRTRRFTCVLRARVIGVRQGDDGRDDRRRDRRRARARALRSRRQHARGRPPCGRQDGRLEPERAWLYRVKHYHAVARARPRAGSVDDDRAGPVRRHRRVRRWRLLPFVVSRGHARHVVRPQPARVAARARRTRVERGAPGDRRGPRPHRAGARRPRRATPWNPPPSRAASSSRGADRHPRRRRADCTNGTRSDRRHAAAIIRSTRGSSRWRRCSAKPSPTASGRPAERRCSLPTPLPSASRCTAASAFIEETLRSIQNANASALRGDHLAGRPGPGARKRCAAPFLSDPRFRLIVQPCRLGWVGNINWLMSQVATPCWCYQQQDDLLDPPLSRRAARRTRRDAPEAAVVYCDIEAFGEYSSDDRPVVRYRQPPRRASSRFCTNIMPAVAFRGLTRAEALGLNGDPAQ